MIYTYDINTKEVVMVSDAPNSYTNKDYADFEADDSAFEKSKTEGTRMFVEDGNIVLK